MVFLVSWFSKRQNIRYQQEFTDVQEATIFAQRMSKDIKEIRGVRMTPYKDDARREPAGKSETFPK